MYAKLAEKSRKGPPSNLLILSQTCRRLRSEVAAARPAPWGRTALLSWRCPGAVQVRDEPVSGVVWIVGGEFAFLAVTLALRRFFAGIDRPPALAEINVVSRDDGGTG